MKLDACLVVVRPEAVKLMDSERELSRSDVKGRLTPPPLARASSLPLPAP
jgi:hypothetical protein